MTPSLHRLTSAIATAPAAPPLTLFPAKPPNQMPQILAPRDDERRARLRLQHGIARRDAALLSLLSLLPSLARPEPAAAFSIGISGPKEWLKEQKKKSSKFLLAPIDASRESLRAAYLILTKASESASDDLEEVQRLFRSAARDCVAEDRNSFVAFQANTGVEVCTFKLIVKNAASLLADKDPVKLEAEAMLDDLIRSFSSLNGLTSVSDLQDMTYRERVADALTNTISSLDKFKQGIKDCLEI
ncbi:uncharacterized protein LOC115670755 isoform X1 [Syzygium oleosum]|uniref:uncharacterized protein LOC115670755 isoform X1 n=1 Tax=Syzygium oleosum TaxID=219896 RepID=UPI0011D2A25B|nr:uncharacterized protein LOC115670755 isoform X1 [Syzygium oleosum]